MANVYFDDFTITHYTGIEQSDDYYAFGLAFNSYARENNTSNQYLYNGKEKQDELDLGWLDYGARMYQPDIGRWGVIDPLSETMTSQSSYNYAFNNPVRFIDLFGMAPGEATIDETEFENAFLGRRRALGRQEKTREEGGAVDILEEYYAQFGMTLEEGVALVNDESGSEDNDENTDTDAQQDQQTQGSGSITAAQLGLGKDPSAISIINAFNENMNPGDYIVGKELAKIAPKLSNAGTAVNKIVKTERGYKMYLTTAAKSLLFFTKFSIKDGDEFTVRQPPNPQFMQVKSNDAEISGDPLNIWLKYNDTWTTDFSGDWYYLFKQKGDD